MTLNEKIKILEQQINDLNGKIDNLIKESGKKDQPPRTTLGGSRILNISYPIDASSGRGSLSGGAVIWNNTEIDAPYGTQPNIPTIGYNKHAHSRFSGGALIKDVIEIVEYDFDSVIPPITNKHTQGFLKSADAPKIKTEQNSKNEEVYKIGLLDLIFNPDGGYDTTNPNTPKPIGTWGVSAYEINVQKCYFVKRITASTVDIFGNPVPGETIGDIEKDSKGQEMKSYLYVTNDKGEYDYAKSSILWDENAKVWRLMAIYAPEPPPVP